MGRLLQPLRIPEEMGLDRAAEAGAEETRSPATAALLGREGLTQGLSLCQIILQEPEAEARIAQEGRQVPEQPLRLLCHSWAVVRNSETGAEAREPQEMAVLQASWEAWVESA